MKKNRNSSIELLRIIAMLLIIAQHYVVHGGFADEIFDMVAPNIIYLKILRMFGYGANTIFALITGYYLIHRDVKEKYYRRILPLVFEIFFYSVCVLIVLLVTKLVPLSIKDILKLLFPLFYGNWYGVYYVLLYMFLPFLNPFLISLDKKDYRRLLKTCIIAFIVIQTFFGNVYKLTNLDFLIVNYIFGAYCGLYPNDFHYDNHYNLYAALLAAFAIAASVIGMDLLGVLLHNGKFVRYDYFLMSWYTIPTFVFSVSLFMYATRRQTSCRIVDLFASTVFGVYLLHDSMLKSYIWEVLSPNPEHVSSPYLHSLVKILLVFLACSFIDLIRQKTVGVLFQRGLDSYFHKQSKKTA